jgi:cytochrome c5
MKKILAVTMLMIFSIALVVSCGGDGKKAVDKAKETVKQEVKKEVAHVADLTNGKKVYDKVCVACHMTGVAGAAPLNDKARWEENAKLGMKELVRIAIHGNPKGKYGVMPERGTCTDCSDEDLADAVAYMLKEAGVTAK